MPTILVVDDDPHIREVVTLYLRRESYEVLAAADGDEALRLSQLDQPQLVVLDLMLSKVPGAEVCRRIQSTRRVPVIMLTAKGEEEDRIIGLGLGAGLGLAIARGLIEAQVGTISVESRPGRGTRFWFTLQRG